MGENKNPLLEDKKETKSEEKIGFNTNAPLAKGQKIEKFQEKLPGKPLRSWTKLCTVFGIIFSTLSAMYFLLPIFAVVIGAILAMVLILFMICSVLFTLGIALTSDGYRDWIGNHMLDVPNFFFNIGDNIAKLAPFFFVAAGPGIGFTTIGLILAIIGKAKQYKYFTSYIVLNAIFLTIALLFTFLYLTLGISALVTQ